MIDTNKLKSGIASLKIGDMVWIDGVWCCVICLTSKDGTYIMDGEVFDIDFKSDKQESIAPAVVADSENNTMELSHNQLYYNSSDLTDSEIHHLNEICKNI